jgi:hypothetical protein
VFLVEIENNIIHLLQVETEQQLQGFGGVWLHDKNFVGLFNLRGAAWATPGTFLGDCLAAREGNVEAIVRLAFDVDALRVGPANPEAKEALGRFGAAMERRPQLTEELTNLQQLPDRETLDGILDQILPGAIWSAIKSLDKSGRARVEKDGTGYYHPARRDPPPPDNPKSKLYFTPNDEWTIHDLQRLRSLLQAHVRNYVEEAIIGYAEIVDRKFAPGRLLVQPDEVRPELKPKPGMKPPPEPTVLDRDDPSIKHRADIKDGAFEYEVVDPEKLARFSVRVARAVSMLDPRHQPIARDIVDRRRPKEVADRHGCSEATISIIKSNLWNALGQLDL